MPDLVKEIREHIGHQWSNYEFVQSERVREIMTRAADEIERLNDELKALKIEHEDFVLRHRGEEQT